MGRPLQAAQILPVSDALLNVQDQPTRPAAQQHVCAFKGQPLAQHPITSCHAVYTAAAPARTDGAKRTRRKAVVESSDSEAEHDRSGNRGCALQQSTLRAAQAGGTGDPPSSEATSAADRSRCRDLVPAAELQELLAELAAEEAALQVGQGCIWGATVQGPVSDVPLGQQAGVDILRGGSWHTGGL